MLTCADVIESFYKPGKLIYFQVEGQETIHSAQIIQFSPTAEQDIALLRPDPPLSISQTLPLSESTSGAGHPFSIFGYPELGSFIGLNGAGTIMGDSGTIRGGNSSS